jgi:hypothetical protein
MVLPLNLPMGKRFFKAKYQVSGIARNQRCRIQRNIHEEFVLSVNRWKNNAELRMSVPTIMSPSAMTESRQFSTLKVATLLEGSLSPKSAVIHHSTQDSKLFAVLFKSRLDREAVLLGPFHQFTTLLSAYLQLFRSFHELIVARALEY